MTGSLAQSDYRVLRDLANRWQDAGRGQSADELHAALNEIGARRAEGGDVLSAIVRGDNVPQLRDAAVAKAMTLWGEKADPVVEHVGDVHPSHGMFRFFATVRVRCLNYAEVAS